MKKTNDKQSVLKNPIVKKLNEQLPLICCIIALAGFLFLPVTMIDKGLTQSESVSGLKFFLNIGRFLGLPGYVGNQGATLTLILLGVFLVFVLCAALAIFGCIKNKKKAFNWGIGIGVLSLTISFIVLLMYPYYVPNSLGRKAFLFTEIGRTFGDLMIGYWLAMLGLVAAILIVEKRERK